MARRRIVLIHPSLLVDMMQGWPMKAGMVREFGVTVTSDAPDDLRVIGCGWDEQKHVIRLAVESDTFEDVPDGYFAPEWEPMLTRHVDPMTEYEAAMVVLGRKA